MDERVLFLVKVATEHRLAVLRRALDLGVRSAARGGPRELLLLAAMEGPEAAGAAARALAEMEGVEAVDCSLALPPTP